jgi:hypothetical protein
MAGSSLRKAFLAFHLTLGIVVFILGVMTLHHSLRAAGGLQSHHLAILAGVEAISAILFLIPGTLRIGGLGLLLTFAAAIVVHALQGEFPGPILIYAAGTVLVMVHGSAWGTKTGANETPAQ